MGISLRALKSGKDLTLSNNSFPSVKNAKYKNTCNCDLILTSPITSLNYPRVVVEHAEFHVCMTSIFEDVKTVTHIKKNLCFIAEIFGLLLGGGVAIQNLGKTYSFFARLAVDIDNFIDVQAILPPLFKSSLV